MNDDGRYERRRERNEATQERSDAAAERDTAGAEVAEPPWWTSPKRRIARSSLSREAIIDAAFVVLDRDGLDGLSMRRVADELGTGPASLYWHVANKEQLLNVLLDRVIGEIDLPEPDPDHWEQQLRQLARDGRAAFSRHRDLARATMGRIPIGPNLLHVVEWQLALLRGAGIADRPAAWFGDLFALYIAAHAFEDSVADRSADQDESPDDEAAMGAYMAQLPPAVFPNLMAVAGELMSGDADARFEFGLDLLIAGLATRQA